jgi:hypothetical protein
MAGLNTSHFGAHMRMAPADTSRRHSSLTVNGPFELQDGQLDGFTSWSEFCMYSEEGAAQRVRKAIQMPFIAF